MDVNSPCKGYLVYLICDQKMSFKDVNERLRSIGYPVVTEAFVKQTKKDIKDFKAVYQELELGTEIFNTPEWAGVTILADDKIIRNRVNLLILDGQTDEFISDWVNAHFIWGYKVGSISIYRKFYFNIGGFSRKELETWALEIPEELARDAYVNVLRGHRDSLERYCHMAPNVDTKEALTDMVAMAYRKFKQVMDVPANDSSIHAFRMAQIVRDMSGQLDRINKSEAATKPDEEDSTITHDLSVIPTLEEYHNTLTEQLRLEQEKE